MAASCKSSGLTCEVAAVGRAVPICTTSLKRAGVASSKALVDPLRA